MLEIDIDADGTADLEGAYARLRLTSIPPIKMGWQATATTPELAIEIHIADAWLMYQAINKIGIAAAARIAGVGVQFMHVISPPRPEQEALLNQITGQQNYQGMMENIMHSVQAYHQGKSFEDLVILFTHEFLRQKKLTREDAARVATILLNRDPPITKEAWQKRVDRYAKARGLPAVRQRQPKSKRK